MRIEHQYLPARHTQHLHTAGRIRDLEHAVRARGVQPAADTRHAHAVPAARDGGEWHTRAKNQIATAFGCCYFGCCYFGLFFFSRVYKLPEAKHTFCKDGIWQVRRKGFPAADLPLPMGPSEARPEAYVSAAL